MNNVVSLYKKFAAIRRKGWVPAESNDFRGVGLTFETLIGKDEDNFYLPDYRNIEIKTFEIFAKGLIHLFNATPDGDYLYPIERIRDTLGYPDTKDHKYKVFNAQVFGNKLSCCGYHKKLILKVDYEHEKIDFIAYLDNKNLDIGISWSFKLLEERLSIKLKNLAVIKAALKKEGNKKYFYYSRFDFYVFKGFDTFIKLIEEGTIGVTFKIGVFRSGKRLGQVHDRGTDFFINYEDIEKLYTKVNYRDYWNIKDDSNI